MTDKEKLNAIRAEVEKYIDAARKAHTNITQGNFAHLLSFIDSLQEEPVSDDLHAVAKEYADNITDKIGYNLQLRRAVVYGAKWKEKQIIKDAIDGKVIANGMGSPILHLWDKGREFIGDKVKVIIIKSE